MIIMLLVPLRMVPLRLCGHQCATQGKMVLSPVHVFDEETWRTEKLIRQEEEVEER